MGTLDKLPGANVPRRMCRFPKPRLSGGLSLCHRLGGTRRDSAHGGAEGKAPPCLPALLSLLRPLFNCPGCSSADAWHAGGPAPWGGLEPRSRQASGCCAASGFRNRRMSACVPVRWTTGVSSEFPKPSLLLCHLFSLEVTPPWGTGLKGGKQGIKAVRGPWVQGIQKSPQILQTPHKTCSDGTS